jgi:hypothetical protein
VKERHQANRGEPGPASLTPTTLLSGVRLLSCQIIAQKEQLPLVPA